MNIEYTEVYGFNASMRGMRNPLDSWEKSDSKEAYEHYDELIFYPSKEELSPFQQRYFYNNYNEEGFFLGEEDKKLAQKLTKSGSEHCKFLRQIHVWADLTLPRYIWSEFDTYKFNTKNSCSTMHTAHRRFLKEDDFERPIQYSQLDYLNNLIEKKKNKEITSDTFIGEFKSNLPESFLQKRTVDTSYAELLNILHQRKNHRLSEWHKICDWILELPYFKELTGVE